jgi:trimeric autotransporter adhesin
MKTGIKSLAGVLAFMSVFPIVFAGWPSDPVNDPILGPIPPTGMFSVYFQNMIGTNCPIGEGIVGFSGAIWSSYGVPDCRFIDGIWRYNGATNNIYYNTGSVGIGTATPWALLDVRGDTLMNSLTLGRGAGNLIDNTVFGFQALPLNTSWYQNTAIGYQSLFANTTWYLNTAIGYRSLSNSITADNNVGLWGFTLLSNTTGQQNTAIGVWALSWNTVGFQNTVVWNRAMGNNTSGNYNTALGVATLGNNTSGNYNTALGIWALSANTTGTGNIGIGHQAGSNITTWSYNIALWWGTTVPSSTASNQLNIGNSIYGSGVGTGTPNIGINTQSPTATLDINGQIRIRGGNPLSGGLLTTNGSWLAVWTTPTKICTPGGTGSDNMCYGDYALQKNTSGINNVAIWGSSLRANTVGSYNLALWWWALSGNTTGNNNVAIGQQSLYSNTTWSYNTANGLWALYSNTNWSHNIANGPLSLYFNTNWIDNIANGSFALYSNTNWTWNIANGRNALYSNTTWSYNTANGLQSLYSNTVWSYNIANGVRALYSNTNWTWNVAIWYQSSYAWFMGSYKVSLGYNAGSGITTASNIIALGANTYFPSNTLSNQLNIGNSIYGSGIGTSNLRIGIGKNNPQDLLDLAWWRIRFEWDYTTPTDGAGYIYKQSSGTTVSGYQAILETGNAGSRSARLTVSYSGYVGIGTMNPLAPLDIQNNGIGHLWFTSYWAGDWRSHIQAFDSAWVFRPLSIDASELMLSIQGTGNILIPSGNVGIGVSNPTQRLHVNGDALINNLTVWKGAGSRDMNSAFGEDTLTGNLFWSGNSAFGYRAMRRNTNGIYNSAFWQNALQNNTTWNSNVALGASALGGNSTASNNTAVWVNALSSTTTGWSNVAIGTNAANLNTIWTNNTSIWVNAAQYVITNSNNTVVWASSFRGYYAGNQNTILGQNTLNQAQGIPFSTGVSTGTLTPQSSTELNITPTLSGVTTGDVVVLWIWSGNTIPWVWNYAYTVINPGRIQVLPTYWAPFGSTGSWVINGVTRMNGLTSDRRTVIWSNAWNIRAWGNNSILIGADTNQTTNTWANQLNIGNALFGTNLYNTGGTFRLWVGIDNPTANLDVNGTIRIRGGNPLSGGLLTTNGSGFAVWTTPTKICTPGGTGTGNMCYGDFALQKNTTGIGNIALGDSALRNNTTASYNTAIWFATLSGNTTGDYNLALGDSAMTSNTTGYDNVALWSESLYSNKNGRWNIGIWYATLRTNISGRYNIANGVFSLYSNTTGRNNMAMWDYSLYSNINWTDNVAIGSSSLYSNIDGKYNIANGTQALYSNTSWDYNIAHWVNSLYTNSIGTQNVAIGSESLRNNTVWSYNSAFWIYSLNLNTTWNYNVGLGYQAGSNITTGNTNIAIWYNAQVPSATSSNQLSIGNWIYGNNGNIGIGTSSPWSKLEVAWNTRIMWDLTVQGKVITDTLVNRTVNNISISWSILPDTAAPLVYRDIWSSAQKWNNLYLAGNANIGGMITWAGFAPTYAAWGSMGTGDGGAALYNDNGTYKKLMIVGNTSAWWSREVGIWDNLTVAGSATIGGSLTASSFMGAFSNANMSIPISGITYFNWGNVGIGTSTPWAKLEVAGQVKITGGTPWVGKVLVSDAAGLASWGSANQVCPGTGTDNVCYWSGSLWMNITWWDNTALWNSSMFNNIDWSKNVAIWKYSLYANTWWTNNTAIWWLSMMDNVSGTSNTAIWAVSLASNTRWIRNTAIWAYSLPQNIVWSDNIAIWDHVMEHSFSWDYNVAIWNSAMSFNIIGDYNTAIWVRAWYLNNGDNNIAIWYNVQLPSSTGSNQLNIGNWIYGNNGNIGIGVTNPTQKLEVNGNISTSGTVFARSIKHPSNGDVCIGNTCP